MKPKHIPFDLIILSCLLGALFYCFETILETAPATMVNPLMHSFHVDAAHVGILDTSMFITYCIMQIPGGVLLDRFGAKTIMPIAALFVAIGMAVFSLSHSFGFALFGRALSGIGQAFGLLGAMFIVSSWVKNRFLALSLGLTMMIGLSGGLLEGVLINIVHTIGWRYTISILALIAIFFALAFGGFLRDNPDRPHRFTTPWCDTLSVVLHWRYWPIAIFGGLLYMPTATLGSMWGINFFKAHYPQLSDTVAAELNTMIFLGWIIGSPLIGWVSDLLRHRKWLLVLSTACCLIILLILTYAQDLGIWLNFILMFLLGLFSSFSGLTFAMGCEINRNVSGTALGFINMLAILPAIFITPIFGAILDHFWTGHYRHASKIFSFNAYQHAMILVCAIIAAALLISIFLIKDTFQNPEKQS